MQLHYNSVWLLPVVTGLVGYFTNVLAIKMLFRPFRPHWYTLGWQGVIPRTRPLLAKNTAKLVSEKLLSEQDVLSAVSSAEFKTALRNAFREKLSAVTRQDVSALIGKLDAFSSDLFPNADEDVEKLTTNLLRSLPAGKAVRALEAAFLNSFDFSSVCRVLSSETISAAKNEISSGKTLREIIPDFILNKTDDLCRYLTDVSSSVIKDAGRSAAVKEAAAEKLAEFKNSFFGKGGKNTMKQSLLNVFVDDETIKNAVKREFPAVMDDLADNQTVKAAIFASIKTRITEILGKKLSEAANEAFVSDAEKELKTRLSSEKFEAMVKENAEKIIRGAFRNNYSDERSAYEILENSGIDVAGLLKSVKPAERIKKFIRGNEKEISEKIVGFLRDRRETISDLSCSVAVEAVKSNLEAVLHGIDIEKTVEAKINGLDLPQVENMLFCFMKSHFKWINILGFIIGFIIGAAQCALSFILR